MNQTDDMYVVKLENWIKERSESRELLKRAFRKAFADARAPVSPEEALRSGMVAFVKPRNEVFTTSCYEGKIEWAGITLASIVCDAIKEICGSEKALDEDDREVLQEVILEETVNSLKLELGEVSDE